MEIEVDLWGMFVSVPEAARRLGLSRSRVYQFVRSGRLPAQRVGREYLVSLSDLQRFTTIGRATGRPRRST